MARTVYRLTAAAACFGASLALTACGGGGSSVSAIAQTVTLSAPTTGTVGQTASLSASASSGLSTFSYASSTPTVCTVAGSTLTYVAAGSCSVTATQAGDANYTPASSTASTITVSGAVVQASTLTFASGFAASNLTAEGGGYGGYGGSGLISSDNSSGGGGAPISTTTSPPVTAADSNFYYYFQTTVPYDQTTDQAPNTASPYEYMGVFVQAPHVTTLNTSSDTNGVTVNGQTHLNFTLNENTEWFNSSNNNFVVLMTLGKYYSVNGGACNIKLATVVTPTALAATAYSIPLSNFVVTQNCGTNINTASAALATAPVSQIDFQADGGGAAITVNGLQSGANNSVINTQYSVYPSTIALQGAITFTP